MMTDIDTVYVRTAGFASIGVLSFHEIQKAEQFYPKALTKPHECAIMLGHFKRIRLLIFHYAFSFRGVAQFGSALGSGASGRSDLPPSKKRENVRKTEKKRDRVVSNPLKNGG